MTATWHISAAERDVYLGGDVDATTASSIEAHLLACDRCRRTIALRSDASDLDRSWAAIEARLDAAPSGFADRLGDRLGLRADVTRVLAPTAALQVGWIIAGAAAFLVSLLLARSGIGAPGQRGRVIFLTVAPLIPLAAVVSSLGAASEPAPEVARATPVSRLRIGALRAGTVLGVTIIGGLVASAVVPGPWSGAVGWLCPALALSGLGAALSHRWSSTATVGLIATGWVGFVMVAAVVTDDRLAAFQRAPQLGYLAVAVAAVVFVAATPSSYEWGRVR